jgi:ketosteroid isomerase-like protein
MSSSSRRRWSDDPALIAYCRFFERLTPADLDRLDAVFAPEARFQDPFNDVRGRDALRGVFARMFERCVDVRFEVHEALRDGDLALLHWTMRFRPAPPRGGGTPGAEWALHGMSRIAFAADGRVIEHVDHWDTGAQLYARLPLIGPVVRWLQRKLA